MHITFDSSQIMTLFIYQNDKLYADMRKTVSFPNAEIIKPLNETKVHKTPYCVVAMGGIPLDVDKYLDQVTMVEAVTFTRDVLLDIYTRNKNSSYTAYTTFEKVFAYAADALVENPCFNGHTFVAMTNAHVWCKTGNPGEPIRRYDNEGSCAAGAGDEFAKILLTNNISPEEIYPAIRRVGIPVGETFEIHRRSELNAKLKPPYRSRTLWINVLRDMINHPDSEGRKEELASLMYFAGIIQTNGIPSRKLSANTRKAVDLFIHDYSDKQMFKETAMYKNFLRVIEKQVKERIL